MQTQRAKYMRGAPEAERFWAKVDRSGTCWNWTAARKVTGYGSFQRSSGRRSAKANRVAWELTHGPIPDGLCVLHRCDNPPCCNPAHLFLGTQLENIRDRDAKGRHRPLRGEEQGRAKLTDAAVVAIRAAYCGRRGQMTALARQYGVSRRLILNVVTRRTWRHVA